MSTVIIKDGTGTGKSALVTSKNRLLVDATNEPIENHACDSGDKYNINTGDITLTNATKTSVIYVKNNEDDDLVITSLIYNLGSTTGGSGDVKFDIIRNPTTGDIITNANNVLVGTGVEANQNFGSNKSLTINAYKGASGETAVNGSVSVTTRNATPTGRTVIALGSIILPKGSSIAVDYTPPTGNTSQKVQFAIACYLKTLEVGGF